jgi:hypothetical protein
MPSRVEKQRARFRRRIMHAWSIEPEDFFRPQDRATRNPQAWSYNILKYMAVIADNDKVKLSLDEARLLVLERLPGENDCLSLRIVELLATDLLREYKTPVLLPDDGDVIIEVPAHHFQLQDDVSFFFFWFD